MLDARSNYQEAAHNNGYEFSQGSGYQLPEYPFVEPPELKTGEVKRHDIVIVGGGLAGLTLACALAQFGVKALLLDEDNTVGVKGASSRGICYAQKTLEIFKRLGLYDRIAAKGVQWSVGRTFAGHDEVYSFDLKNQQTHNVSVQPPFINIQQFYVEGFLVEQIYQNKVGTADKPSVDLRWSHRITAFEQTGDFATLQLRTPAGSYTLEATHVVDCSGARSPFRAWCGVSVTAKKGDDRWCIADVRFKNPPAVERHTWIEAPFNENRAVWQHLMADGVWRIDYQMRPDADPEEVSREDVVRERINGQLGRKVDPNEYEIVWVGPYAYRSECLDQLRHGRVLFVGDAAHVVSPFGARGGNSGVQDADNLAWKLAAVVQRRAAPELLDSFHAERHEAAKHNVLVTNRTARFLRPLDGAERVFRSAAISLAKRHAFARQLVNTGRMSSPNVYSQTPACHSSGGRPAQNVALTWIDGGSAELTDLLTWARGNLLLLVFGDVYAQDVKRLVSLSRAAPVRCVQVVASRNRSQVKESVVDINGHLLGTCTGSSAAGATSATIVKAPPTRWALLRPDTYIAATGSQINSELVKCISAALGHTE